jgi:hypothetical protein
MVAITHRGTVEVERSIASPDEPTEHFQAPVIQHFYAPVGACKWVMRT